MAAIKVAARKIIDSHPELKLMVLSDYDLASHFRGRYGIPEYNGHAGAIETSRLLAMNKELVRSQGVPEEPSLPPFMVVAEPEKYFSTGVMGDPTRATVELGKKIRSYVVEQMVKLIKEQME
jgi:creatinine amidohydrolase